MEQERRTLQFNGLIAVRRGLPYDGWNSASVLKRSPAVDMSDQDIAKAYKGFDGSMFPDPYDAPFEGRVVSLEKLSELTAFRKRVTGIHTCDILYLDTSPSQETVALLGKAFGFCGYDVGYYEWAYNKWSSVLGEVIYGLCPEMRSFAEHLNSGLLLPSLDLAQQLQRTRAECIMAKGDVPSGLEVMAEGEECAPVGVYCLCAPV